MASLPRDKREAIYIPTGQSPRERTVKLSAIGGD